VSDGPKGSEDFEKDVGFGGFTDYTFTKSSGFTQAYTLYTINYVAKSSSTILEFAGADGDNSAFLLDTISVVDNGAVPEPATFALVGAGLVIAGLGGKLRRRK
jgi:PEP-CTERM motif